MRSRTDLGRRARLALTALAVLVLAAAFVRLPWGGVLAALSSVRPLWIVMSLVIGAGGIALRALRLRTVLGPETGFKSVWASAILGYFTSLVVPFGGGEATKALALSRAAGLPLARAASAVGLDRLFDLGTLAVLAAAALVLHAAPAMRSGPLMLVCAVFALGMLSASLSVLRKDAIGRWLEALPFPGGGKAKLISAYGHWHEQALRLKRPGIWPALGALQAAVLVSDTSAAWCGLHALPSTAGLGPAAALQLNLFVMLAFALPLLPGSLGTLQAAYAMALAPFGVSTAISIAIGLIGQAAHTVLVGALGLAVLARLPAGLRRAPSRGQSES